TNLTPPTQESAELLRWLPTAFSTLHPSTPHPGPDLDLYPPSHRAQIAALTPLLQRDLNAGVYAAGFATTQAAYDAAVVRVFGALNALEALVAAGGGPYVLGPVLTELDVRVFVTVVRFDVVYVQHFKCNLGMVRREYPVLGAWLRALYWGVEGCRETTEWRHIKENYTKSHYDINPRGITPMGPYPDIEEGVETDFSKLSVGGVKMPAVLEYQKTLEQEYQKALEQEYQKGG
ncbi:glutathione S-transferase, partial [Glonium stellatum]